MTLKIVIAAIVLILLAAVLVARKSDTVRIQRTLAIKASPDKIFALIGDFKQWPQWAPQDREDQSMQRTFTGSQYGVGAVSEWKGKGSSGAGRMEIVEAERPNRIKVKVDFAAPFTAHNINEFVIAPHDGSSLVTWSMQGSNPMIARVMSLFVNMDRIMGRHFETGLANLKAAAER